MTDGPKQGRRGFRKWNIFWLIVLIGLAAFGLSRYSVHRKLDRRVDVLRGQGYPMSLIELDTLYRESDDRELENAWPVYLEACESFTKHDSDVYGPIPGYDRLPNERGRSWDPNHLENAQAFLADNKACLELLFTGADIGYCFRPIDFTQGHNVRLDWLSETRDCARLLCLASRIAVQQGDVDEALRAVEAIFPLTESVKAPVIVMNLVRLSVWRLAIAQIEDLLAYQALSLEQLQRLDAWLGPMESTDGFTQCMIGERCSSLYLFEMPPQEVAMYFNDNGVGLWPLLSIPRKFLGFHDLDALSCINAMQAHIDITDLPRHEAYQRSRAVGAEYEDELGMLTRMLMPAMGRVYEIELIAVAKTVAARTALAVERYRQDKGRLPETLDQLVPAFIEQLALDPFDGQPLRYRLLEKGYVVYTVGTDLTDNQGEERRADKDRKNQPQWDETFTVSR